MNDYFFSKILLDLQARLSAEVPELEYIDQQLGQLSQIGENERPPLAYPAVLIDFPNTGYSDLANNIQMGAVQIAVQLVFDNYYATWHEATLEVRKEGLEYLEIEQKVYKALQGWCEDYFTPLSRTNVKSQNNNDVGLRVREMTFYTEYEDYTLDDDIEKEVEFKFSGKITRKD